MPPDALVRSAWPRPGTAPSGRPACSGAAPSTGSRSTDGTVLDVEPVSPRPLPPYDPSKEKSRQATSGPPPRGEHPLPGEKARKAAAEERKRRPSRRPSEITIHLLKGDVRDYKVKRTNLKRVEYFEDMLLAEGDRYRLARDFRGPSSATCGSRRGTRAGRGSTSTSTACCSTRGARRLLEGTGENGLRLLGELAARRPDYPGLADKLATAYGSRIARAFELGLYAAGRKVLHDLEPLAPNHAVVREARERFIARARR